MVLTNPKSSTAIQAVFFFGQKLDRAARALKQRVQPSQGFPVPIGWHAIRPVAPGDERKGLTDA